MTETKFLVNSDSNPHLLFLFGISNIGHCVLFVICYLVLGIFPVQGLRELDINGHFKKCFRDTFIARAFPLTPVAQAPPQQSGYSFRF